MTRHEIRDSYIDAHCPGLTGYAYQATTWCIECGQFIARRILRQWSRAELAAVTHADLCDSERFPQPIVFDDCEYCDNCGDVSDD